MKPGVYQDESGKWTWYSAEDQVHGTPVATRPEARGAYHEHIKELQAEQAAAGTATAPAPADNTPATEPASTKKEGKVAAAKKGKKTAKAAGTRKAGAVSKVWDIAAKMPKADRKDVIAACVKAGINENTAKTQYQRWLHRGDK